MSENNTHEATLTQYDELAARRNAAYVAFKAMYELQNPPPQAPRVEGVDWLTVGALGVMVVASVIVSGSRTVVEFGGGFVGLAAFAMLELGIVVYAYVRTKKHYDEARHQSVKRLVSSGMFLALTVAVVANLHATAKQNGVVLADWINVVILLLVAISAPILAFIAGDVLGMEAVSTAHRKRKAQAQYDDALALYRVDLNKAFQVYAPRMGASIKVEREISNGISIGNPVENDFQTLPSASTLGHRKKPNASEVARAYLTQDGIDLESVNPLEVAAHLGVGKSTVYNVLNELRAGK